jgi:hypothetical protein
VKKVAGVLAVFFSLLTITSFAQSGAHLRISVLTCAPGDELYSLFGHTALRITDSTNQTDVIYNYGTFDFNDPDFYTKFVRGKLNYFLSVQNVPGFLYEYQMTNRAVIEQELLLSDSEKRVIADAIAKNLEGDNRYYKYDFLYDNCTSRIRDILINHAGMHIDKRLTPEGTSFRNMIHEYLDRGRLAWTKLGMDILLGVPADKKVTINESMFLPDYLMKGIDSSLYSAKPVLLKKQYLLNVTAAGNESSNNGPLYILSIISIVAIILSYIKNKAAKIITRVVSSLFFLLTGSIGLLLLFLWFGTDHTAFGGNYNLLWALPTNIIPAFASWKSRWLKKYFFVSAVLYALLLASWFWLPQQLNIALAPVALLLLVTTARLSKI